MKGEVRDPMTVWLITFATCGLYGLYVWYLIGNELKEYLNKEDLNPTMDLVLALVCCLYPLYLPIKYGKLIQEAQQKAGMTDAQDQGVMFLLLMFAASFGYYKIQEELNKVWEA